MKRTELLKKMSAVLLCSLVGAITGISFGQTNGSDAVLFGKVIDQNSQPVAGATMHALVYGSLDNKAQPAAKLVAQTNAEGLFELNSTGVRLDILAIKKTGYEFSAERKKDLSFVFAGLPAKELFVPDPANPVVFTIRKKNDPALLVRSKGLRIYRILGTSIYALQWAAPLRIPPNAVCHYRGARVASQCCSILPNSSDIIHIHAVALKR